MIMIPIKKEPKECYETTHVYENCYFCNKPTDTWNIETNQPVCALDAKIHNVNELPNLKLNRKK